jgi:hypothetical protein
MRSTPSVATVVAALGGMVLLGVCAAAGSLRLSAFVPGTFITLASVLGAVLLTTPAFVALHQFLGLSARPEATVAALSGAVVAGGRVAAGLAPACLFFAATTQLWLFLLGFALAIPGVVTAVVAAGSLRAAEGEGSPRFTALLAGWMVLTSLIALRISFDLVRLTIDGVAP